MSCFVTIYEWANLKKIICKGFKNCIDSQTHLGYKGIFLILACSTVCNSMVFLNRTSVQMLLEIRVSGGLPV